MKKSHFLDIVRNEILEDHSGHKCEVCGYYKSEGCVMVYARDWEDSDNVYLCDDCVLKIKSSKKLDILS
jgi:hypothetical protein